MIEPLMTRLVSALACWSSGALTTCGTSPMDAGRKNASQMPMPDLEQRQVPHLGDARDQQRRGERLQAEPQEVGDQHDVLARQAVRPDAADEHEDGQRHEVGGLDDADVGRGAADLEHGEGEGDVREHDADDGGRLSEEQLAVFGFAQRGEVVGELAHAGILLGR